MTAPDTPVPSTSATDTPASGTPPTDLSAHERVGHYIEMYKKSVEVQMHFNEIEWRIRGLALTVATFALGAAGLAVKERTEVGPVSLGAIITFVGLLLWYAFYFVDRAWYHPLLKAAVTSGTEIEDEIRAILPKVGMTRAITDGSGYRPGSIVSKISGKTEMRSDDKLVWFYSIGAAALVLVTAALQAAAFFTSPTQDPPTKIQVHIDGTVLPTPTPTPAPPEESDSPSPSSPPPATPS